MDICLNQGKFVGQIRGVGDCVRVGGGGNRLKCLKTGWNRKEWKGNKDFKKRGQAGSRGGCLKKGGAGTPLGTMFSNNR